jgi:branched-chain amino acid transport system substrate-binding protein
MIFTSPTIPIMGEKNLKKVFCQILMAMLAIEAVTSTICIQPVVANRNCGTKAGDPLKIGVLGPMAWIQGQGIKEGAEIARDTINDNGGILVDGIARNIELVFADTLRGQQYPSNATGQAAATDLVSAGCDFVTGGYWSDEVYGAREVLMDNHAVFLISGAPEDRLIDGVESNYDRYKYLFRVAPFNLTTLAGTLWGFERSVLQSKLLPIYGKYLWEGAPNKQVKVAVISENISLWDDMYENMTDPNIYPNTSILGPYANVTYSARVNVDTTDFSTILGGINDSGARLIVHLFSTQASVNFTKQWKELGLTAICVGIDMVSQSYEFWQQTGGKCEYETTIAPIGTETPTSPEALAFYWESLARYGHAPISTSWGSYEAIRTLAEAIEAAGTTGTEAVVAELEQTDRSSTLGRFKFTSDHDVFCNETSSDWYGGYMRPFVVQWLKSRTTGQPRQEVVNPARGRAGAFAREWRIPSWMYQLADTDLNLDGKVDILDAVILSGSFGKQAGPPGVPRGDIDGNGIVNIVDASMIERDFTKNVTLPLGKYGESGDAAWTGQMEAEKSSNTTVYLAPFMINGTAIGVNNTVTVDLNIRDVIDLYSWQAGITFNVSLLECTGVFMGELMQIGSLMWQLGLVNNTLGEITPTACSLQGEGSKVSGSGRLAYLNFKVKAAGVSDIHLRDCIVMDYWGVENYTMMPFNIIDTFTIVHSPAQTVSAVSNSTGVQTAYEFVNGEPVLVKIGSGFYDHNFSQPDQMLHFNVTGPYLGFSNITVPKTLMQIDFPDQLLLVEDGVPLKTEERTVTENSTHYFVYFNYTQGVHGIRILKRPPAYDINTNTYYATIQEAINSLETLEGDAIMAFEGTHYENVVLNKSISLIGRGVHNTTIDANDAGPAIRIAANNANVSGFTLRNSATAGSGILVDGSISCNVSDNILTDDYYGIRIVNSMGSTISNNNVLNNVYGIVIDSSSTNTLDNNIIEDNQFNFGIRGSDTDHFNNVISESNLIDGKPIRYVREESDTIYDLSTNAGALCLIDCDNVTVKDLTISKNVDAIFLWNTTNSNILNCTFSSSENGIYLQGGSSHNTIADNIIINNYRGIYIDSSSNNAVHHNCLIDNSIQASVLGPYSNVWDGGYPSGGNWWTEYSAEDYYHGMGQDERGNDGIWDHEYTIDSNNRDNYPLISPLIPPIYNIQSRLGYTKIQDAIVASQTADGNTIIVRSGTYHENLHIDKSIELIGIEGSTVIDGDGVETTVIITANNVIFRGFTVQGSGTSKEGVLLSYSNGTVIDQNAVVNNGHGIRLDHSNDCSIKGNVINNNAHDGIHSESSNATVITRNILRNDDNGIVLTNCRNNDIHRNNVTDEINRGIFIYSSSNCAIYHNNFINNPDQVDTYASTNAWDNGYPSGGNYWSDYIGEDKNHGPYQNETGSDGIGDKEYPIDANNKDNYPLINQRPAQHDVAVVEVTPSKRVVGQGFSLSITVTVGNLGDYVETFNFTLDIPANSTIIVLVSESFTTLTFTWNTTSFPIGDYNITAAVETVLGETNIANNNCSGAVHIGLPGNLNADSAVDSTDLGILGSAWGAFLGDANYVPEADIDDNGVVDSTDLGLMGAHWGEFES